MNQTVNKIMLLFLILLLGSYQRSYQHSMRTKIILTEGGNDQERFYISNILTKVIQEINKKAAGKGNLRSISKYCTNEGFQSIVDLANYDKICSNLDTVKSNLIEYTILDNRYFEVRNIQVKIGRLSSETVTVTKNLVFTLDSHGLIIALHYALEDHEYKNILQFGKAVTDEFQRIRILKFLEEFQTAYNRKNLEYLKRVFSDQALIIVGLVIRESEQKGDFLEEYSFLNQGEVKLIRLSKQQYLERLKTRVFERNSWINVKYESIKIIPHDTIPNIYGVELFQRYYSQYYSDRGYLFLMFDFQNEEQPVIHVRCWQERPFSDSSYIGLYDFRFAAKPKLE